MCKRGVLQYSWLLPLAAGVLSSLPAQASLIINFVPVTVAAGTIGASFDVNLTNSGPSAQTISAFSLGLSVSDSHITFTGGNTATTQTYLFNGDSFDVINAFPFTTVPPPNGQTVEASDNSNSGAGKSVASGATVGLGHILFNVAGNTSAGHIAVSLVSTCATINSCTSLSDAAGANLAFAANGGNITVTASAMTPEPSTLLLALCAIPALAWKRRKSA